MSEAISTIRNALHINPGFRFAHPGDACYCIESERSVTERFQMAQEHESSSPPKFDFRGNAPKNRRSLLLRLWDFYFTGGLVYFFWTLAVLQFRECGLFGGQCIGKFDPSGEIILGGLLAIFPQVIVYSVIIAFFRGILWLPELVIQVLRGGFLDWLLLRDIPSMREFLGALAGILP